MSPPIPPEIISDILVRLPVKPLLRFRTVSKPWCALNDSSYFTKRHLKQSSTTKSNRSLYLYADGTLYYLDYSALQSAIRLKTPFEEVRGVNIVGSCTGSCNGLFLLRKEDYNSGRIDISLFNPATRQFRVIPDSQIEFPSDQVSSSLADFGFGYDSVNDDYKVMKFVQFTGSDYRWISSEARIYSLKKKSWHKIEKFPYCLPLINRNFGVHLNGRLHSVVYTSDEANLPEIMVAFDLSTEEFHYIPFPNGFNEMIYIITVDVFEGMLCVQGTYEGYRTDIWLMREYGANESWFMLLSSPPLLKPNAAIFPIIMSSNGQEVLLNHDYENLMWYDLERKCIRMSPFQGLPGPFGFGVEVCVDSLVPVNSIEESQGEETEERQGRETEGNEVKEEGHGADSSIAGTYS